MSFPILFSILFIIFINTPVIFGDEMQSQPQSAERPKSDQEDQESDQAILDLLIKQAHGILDRFTDSATDYMEKTASGFDIERSLRVQQHLFREDLVWQTRGFSSRQIDAMVFVTVALSLESAISEAESLSNELAESIEMTSERSKKERRLEELKSYKIQATILLEKLSPKLRNISDSEIRFYF